MPLPTNLIVNHHAHVILQGGHLFVLSDQSVEIFTTSTGSACLLPFLEVFNEILVLLDVLAKRMQGFMVIFRVMYTCKVLKPFSA